MTQQLAQIVDAITVHEADGSTWLDLSSSPGQIEILGEAAAGLAAGLGVTAVVSWWDPDQTVLAHIVARLLAVPRAAIDIDLGLLSFSPALPVGRDVLLVVTEFDQRRSIETMQGYLEGQGHRVVGAVNLDAELGVVFSKLP